MKRNSITLLATLALGVTSALAIAQPPRGGDSVDPDRLVDRLDIDGDGVLSLAEFREPPRAWARFDRADSNADGMITMLEVEARIAAEAERQLARAERMFAMADLDNDGAITDLERKTAMFNRVDEDGDGYVSAEELATLKEDRRDRRRDRARRAD